MFIHLVPALTVILINLCLTGYVLLRLKDESRSRVFLMMSGIILIFWASGEGLHTAFGVANPAFMAPAYLALLLVPANLLIYGLMVPKPLGKLAQNAILFPLCVGIALLLTVMEDYSSGVTRLFGYTFRVDDITINGNITRASILFGLLCLTLSLVVFSIRYATLGEPDRIVFKQLIAVVAGPLLFAAFFWASSNNPSGGTLPSPSLLAALTAQMSLIVVLRQEEIQNPRQLSRLIYLLSTLLLGFLSMNLLVEFYGYVEGAIVTDRTAGWLLVGATLVLLLLVRVGPIEAVLDRVVFGRAADYRRLIDETREELRIARERLRRSERLSVAGELSARVAHEIKNPLGPIKGYTQMMKEKLEKSEGFEHRESFMRSLEIIGEEVENIDKRIRQFLDSTRQPQILIESVEINRLIERCAQIIKLEISANEALSKEAANIQVRLSLDKAAGDISIDPGRIEEALFNIARNALEAMSGQSEGTLRFVSRATTDESGTPGVLITVEDSGPGLSPEMRKHLFELFYTEKEGGTGLGLSITKSVVEAHGGTIRLRDAEKRGTIVELWLPREAQLNPGALLPKVID